MTSFKMMSTFCRCLRHCSLPSSHLSETIAGRLHIMYLCRSNARDCKDETILQPSLHAKNRITEPVRPKRFYEDEDMNHTIHRKRHTERSSEKRNAATHMKRHAHANNRFSKRDIGNEHDWGRNDGFKNGHNEDYNYNYGLPGQGKVNEMRRAGMSKKQGDVLFGVYPVLLALTANRRKIYELLVKPSLLQSTKPLVKQLIALAEQRGVPVRGVDSDELYELSQARPHQGVCLHTGKMNYATADDSTVVNDGDEHLVHDSSSRHVWVVFDSIQDPMNFGAVLRSAYFLGADRVFTVKGNSCPLSPVVSKASAGAMEVISVHEVHSLLDFLQDYHRKGWHILGTAVSKGSDGDSGTEMDTDERVTPLHDIRLTRNTMLILGNEGVGMSQQVAALCDQLVTIKPQLALHPFMDSLNVSVAAGIILHHLTSFKWNRHINHIMEKSN